MGEVVDTGNGMSYNFGIEIARGAVQGLAEAVVGATSLVGAMYALVAATNDLDTMLNKNMVAFGGYANTMKAISYTSDKIMSGMADFGQDDLLAGMRELQRAGLNAKTNFDLVNKAALATGSNFTDVAGAIRSGNVGALAEMGIITDRTATSINNMGLTQQQSMRKVLGFLKQAEGMGMFQNTIKTLPAIMARFKQFGKEFLYAIIGDPKDPEGFANTLKRTLSEVADYFYKNLNVIRKVGTVIGKILTFIIEVSYDFAKFVWRIIKGVIGSTESFFKNFWEKMMSFGLWLEILRVQIKSFFKEYEEEIITIAKLALVLGAIAIVGGWLINLHNVIQALGGLRVLLTAMPAAASAMGGSLLASFSLLLTKLAIFPMMVGTAVIQLLAFGKALLFGGDAMMILNAAMASNPVGLIIVGVIALGAALYLVWKHWDFIKQHIFTIVGILGWLFPPIRMVMWALAIIIDNWEKIKRLIGNIVSWVSNIANLLKYAVIDKMKMLHDWATKIVEKFAFLKDIFQFVKDAVNFLISPIKAISGYVGTLIDKFSNKVAGAVNSTGDALAKQQVAHGDDVNVKKGVFSVNAPKPGIKPSSPLTSPPQYSAPGSSSTSNSGGTVVQSGAVQINVNGANNEEKIAQLVMKYMQQFTVKNNSRTGQNNTVTN